MQARLGVMPGRAAPAGHDGRASWRLYRRSVPAALPAVKGPPATLSYWLLLLFLVYLYACLPLQFKALEAYAPARTVAIAALAVLFLEKGLTHRAVRIASPETWLLLVFAVIAGLSSFGALWPRFALEQGIGLLKMMALYLLVLNTVDSWKKLRLLLAVAVLGGLFPAIGALLRYPVDGYARGARAMWIGIFENSNDLAYSLVLLAPLALALLSTAKWHTKPLYAATALVYVATILLTFSRGGLLALCVVALLCLVRWGTPSARLLGAAMIAATVIFVTAFWTRSDTQGLVDHATLDLRLLTIKIGAAMLADYPVLGVGIGCSLLGWPLYAPSWYPADGWLGVHNTAVQVFTETGLVGGSVFIALVVTTLVGVHRAARDLKRHGQVVPHRLVSAIEISLYGFLACSLTGGYLLSWFPYLLLGLASAARLLAAESLRPAVAAAAPPGPRKLSRRRVTTFRAVR